MESKREYATLGGGCFWCLDAVFQELRGVESVVSGYAGGTVKNPTYRAVCGGDTGHAEVVRVSFDPAVLSYRRLLEVFFAIHDPTTLNRQGADVGTQYRSVIFWHDETQRATAQTLIAELADQYPQTIVTELLAETVFYPAEAEHQSYYQLNSEQRYCQLVIEPKREKFKRLFAELRKAPAASQ